MDEGSAALALLCEAGQYDAVLQFGNPLLKAASAALPFSPLGVGKQPVPHLEHLATDLALSIALAHISLAGGAGNTSSSGDGDALLAPGGSTGDVPSDGLPGLEKVHGHLESALQVWCAPRMGSGGAAVLLLYSSQQGAGGIDENRQWIADDGFPKLYGKARCACGTGASSRAAYRKA